MADTQSVLPRVRSRAPLDALDRRKVLTGRQVAAGKRLYANFALGVVGLRQGRGPGGHPAPAFMDAKVGALQDYERARAHLGCRIWPVVWRVVCGDRTVQEVAAEVGMHPTAAMALVRLGLDLLADYYGLEDQG